MPFNNKILGIFLQFIAPLIFPDGKTTAGKGEMVQAGSFWYFEYIVIWYLIYA